MAQAPGGTPPHTDLAEPNNWTATQRFRWSEPLLRVLPCPENISALPPSRAVRSRGDAIGPCPAFPLVRARFGWYPRPDSNRRYRLERARRVHRIVAGQRRCWGLRPRDFGTDRARIIQRADRSAAVCRVALRRVDLPDPEAPTTASNSPCRTTMSIGQYGRAAVIHDERGKVTWAAVGSPVLVALLSVTSKVVMAVHPRLFRRRLPARLCR